jgi:Zn-dependent peptidase ImmA (M78 family)
MNGKRDVWVAVEEFRAQYPGELGTLPVDVLTVIEVRLKLDVIPFPDLFRKYSVDAAVLPDFSGIFVDERSYKFVEGEPIWLFNRLRFSLAHELGHILLHRDLVGDLKFACLQDFWNWTRRYEQSRYSLEWEANEFGGRLLVPIERLRQDFDTFATHIEVQFPSWWTNAHLREALADQLAEGYGVHKDVISCRLDREELWPTP